MAKKHVVVMQSENPRFRAAHDEHPQDNPKLVYRVEKTTNTLAVKIGEWITPHKVECLIMDETDVTINGPK